MNKLKKLNIDRRSILKGAAGLSLGTFFSQKLFAQFQVLSTDQSALEDMVADGAIENVEIYQSGPDKVASWLYVGLLPRMQRPEGMKIYASVLGKTVRVTLNLTREEVQGYSAYLLSRYQTIERAKNGHALFKWRYQVAERTKDGQKVTRWADRLENPKFSVLDSATYKEYQNQINTQIRPIVSSDFATNLELLKSLFPGNVFIESDGSVTMHVVFPTTTPASGRSQASKFTISIFEERRTHYSVNGSDIFAGFPTFWFNGGVGFHGPIRFANEKDNPHLLSGEDSDIGGIDAQRGKKPTKRWQLSRQNESHGCFRMEHTPAMRAMLPAQDGNVPVQEGKREMGPMDQPLARQVEIIVTNDFDRLKIGDTEYIVGVNYYWQSHRDSQKGVAVDKKQDWVANNYTVNGVKLDDVYEFPYLKPEVVQIEPLGNSFAAMSYLNRAPFQPDAEGAGSIITPAELLNKTDEPQDI